MSDEIDPDRRRFFREAALALAATQFDVTTRAEAQAGTPPAAKPPSRNPGMNTNTSFASLKQINAGLLNVGYAEAGPPKVPPSCCSTAGRTTFIALSR